MSHLLVKLATITLVTLFLGLGLQGTLVALSGFAKPSTLQTFSLLSFIALEHDLHSPLNTFVVFRELMSPTTTVHWSLCRFCQMRVVKRLSRISHNKLIMATLTRKVN